MPVALLIFPFYLKLEFQARLTTCKICDIQVFPPTYYNLKFDTDSVIAKFDTWKSVTKAHFDIIQWTYNQWTLMYNLMA